MKSWCRGAGGVEPQVGVTHPGKIYTKTIAPPCTHDQSILCTEMPFPSPPGAQEA